MPQYQHFSDLTRDVNSVYEQAPEQALALITEFGPGFPPQLGYTYLLRASLTSRLGRAEDAIQILRDAAGAGIRYPARLLQNSRGLAPLGARTDFQELVSRFDRAYQEAIAASGPTIILETPSERPRGPGYPVLVVLHGNNSTAELEVAAWRSVVSAGWLLVMPTSGLPSWTPGLRLWDDREKAHREANGAIAFALEHGGDPTRLVLGGFSAGGLRAIELAVDQTVASRGVITVAAYLTDALVAELPAPEPTRAAYLVIGDGDTSAPSHDVLARRLEDSGARCRLDLRSGLSHAYPANMTDTLRTAMRWIEAVG